MAPRKGPTREVVYIFNELLEALQRDSQELRAELRDLRRRLDQAHRDLEDARRQNLMILLATVSAVLGGLTVFFAVVH